MFDEVASLSVEGVNKSAISRVKRKAWDTVDRWLDRTGGGISQEEAYQKISVWYLCRES